MTMTNAKMIELAERDRIREMQAKCDKVNAQVKKEMKMNQIKENLKFRGRCLKGVFLGR